MRMNGSVYRLADMIGSVNVATLIETYGYVRAVPLPFQGGIICRLRGAVEVLRGNAYAVDWPKAGDLEKALDRSRP
jgi:hypothetical protein